MVMLDSFESNRILSVTHMELYVIGDIMLTLLELLVRYSLHTIALP